MTSRAEEYWNDKLQMALIESVAFSGRAFGVLDRQPPWPFMKKGLERA